MRRDEKRREEKRGEEKSRKKKEGMKKRKVLNHHSRQLKSRKPKKYLYQYF